MRSEHESPLPTSGIGPNTAVGPVTATDLVVALRRLAPNRPSVAYSLGPAAGLLSAPAELGVARSRIADLEAALGAAERRVAEQEQQLARQAEEQNATTEALVEARTEVVDARGRLSATVARVGELEAALEQANRARGAAEQTAARVQGELGKERERADRAADQGRSGEQARIRIAALEAQLKQATRRYEDIKQSLLRAVEAREAALAELAEERRGPAEAAAEQANDALRRTRQLRP